jgi:alpha-L-fucosidase 2
MRLYLSVFLCFTMGIGFAQGENRLWYKEPARLWTEALPLGNGRLGIMDFGGTGEELIQMNESSFWSGGPVHHNINPDAAAYLQKCRNALFKNDFDSATYYAKKMQGVYSENYLPLADLRIHQSFSGTDSAKDYERDLNIRDAVSTTRFTRDGVRYIREIFISAPAQMIILRLRADKEKQISLDVNLKSQLRFKVVSLSDDLYSINGKAPAKSYPDYVQHHGDGTEYEDASGCNGMRYEVSLKSSKTDGKIYTDSTGVHIRSASEVTLFITAATSFNGFDKCPDKEGKDEHQINTDHLAGVTGRKYDELLKTHLEDFHRFYDRVSLTIGDANEKSNEKIPTDLRLEAYGKGNPDHGLEVLYFNYGRYLLISSSRTPDAAANLQGIWNKEVKPPWSSNYTININTQMNYWPVEVCNLPEMSQPLTNLIEHLYVTGQATAKEFYGAHGWVAHHNADIWALSNPVGDFGQGDPRWANWSMGGNWLSRHLWEHYLYTQDKVFLRDTAYPIMRDAARFTFDWLVPDGSGHLVTAPSFSPENSYLYDGDKEVSISVATTMDMSIIRDLFLNTILAAKILGVDGSFQDSILQKEKLLYPMQVGKKGNLQEWYKDYEDVEPHHRHVSHLYGLYPGNIISPVNSPSLVTAAKKTLELRGDDGTGWSLAWKINFWARLLDGNHAYGLFQKLLRLVRESSTNYSGGGGAFPNLFDAHPPFQIDGNFGGTAGVTEMLMQSQSDEIFLLPALPDAWPSGAIQGLRARGGFDLSLNWKNHQLLHAKIISRAGQICQVRSYRPFFIKELKLTSKKTALGYTVSFPTVSGMSYNVETTGVGTEKK